MDELLMRCTARAKAVLTRAVATAKSDGGQLASPTHILLAILSSERGVPAIILERMGVAPDRVRAELKRQESELVQPAECGESLTRSADPTVQLDVRSERMLRLACIESDMLGHQYVGAEHLLLGLLHLGGAGAPQALSSAGAKLVAARETVRNLAEQG